MTAAAIRVFLIDDHEVVREGLRRMLAQCRDMTVVGDAESGESALILLPEIEVDVVVLDLSLPGAQGLDVLRELVALADPPRVLVLTVHDDPDLVRACLRSGAQGYVLKHTSRSELATAIRSVAGGDCFLGADVKDLVIGSESAPAQQPVLSDRELEVLRLMATGLTNVEIGKRLYLSSDTVKSHLGNIYRKLGVDGRPAAVAAALRQRLL
jgi:DNA-binding NarL/FixJ family response regulator